MRNALAFIVRFAATSAASLAFLAACPAFGETTVVQVTPRDGATGVSPQATVEIHFTNTDTNAIQAFLSKNFSDGNAGMVVGLLDQRGSRVLSAGKLDHGTDHEVSGDTVFEIGSVTKVFTSLLALDLARREPVDITKRYDVNCREGDQVVVYRNVLFKGIKTLFQEKESDLWAEYVELEQANGQTIFIGKMSLIKFCEHGKTPGSEVVHPEKDHSP